MCSAKGGVSDFCFVVGVLLIPNFWAWLPIWLCENIDVNLDFLKISEQPNQYYPALLAQAGILAFYHQPCYIFTLRANPTEHSRVSSNMLNLCESMNQWMRACVHPCSAKRCRWCKCVERVPLEALCASCASHLLVARWDARGTRSANTDTNTNANANTWDACTRSQVGHVRQTACHFGAHQGFHAADDSTAATKPPRHLQHAWSSLLLACYSGTHFSISEHPFSLLSLARHPFWAHLTFFLRLIYPCSHVHALLFGSFR